MLFPKVADSFEELVGYIENLAGYFNRDLAEELDRQAAMLPEGFSQKSEEMRCLDPSILEKLAAGLAQQEAAYLVEMAKVEALDTMGENHKVVELLDRHI